MGTPLDKKCCGPEFCKECIDRDEILEKFIGIADDARRLLGRYVPGEGRKHHDGDCMFYASLCNGNPTDGICTCGYAHDLLWNGDHAGYWEQHISAERKAQLPQYTEEEIEEMVNVVLEALRSESEDLDRQGGIDGTSGQ